MLAEDIYLNSMPTGAAISGYNYNGINSIYGVSRLASLTFGLATNAIYMIANETIARVVFYYGNFKNGIDRSGLLHLNGYYWLGGHFWDVATIYIRANAIEENQISLTAGLGGASPSLGGLNCINPWRMIGVSRAVNLATKLSLCDWWILLLLLLIDYMDTYMIAIEEELV